MICRALTWLLVDYVQLRRSQARLADRMSQIEARGSTREQFQTRMAEELRGLMQARERRTVLHSELEREEDR